MKTAQKLLHTLLCLSLGAQLALPAATWAAKNRDLRIEEMRDKAALWVLSIGVSQYADPSINLQYADRDAEAIAGLLASQRGPLFREVHTKVLTNEQATRDSILIAMRRFLGQASENDVVLIFLAGHGVQDRQTNTYYFLPHNARSEDDLLVAGLPMPMFQEAAKGLLSNVDKIILWLDTCHSGAVTLAARGVDVGEDLAESLAQASGQYVLSAGKAGEKSIEKAEWRLPDEPVGHGHGAFTYSVLNGLRGAAAGPDSVIWLSELFTHVSREVPKLTEGKQHPHGDIQGTDLPFFITTLDPRWNPPASSNTPPAHPQITVIQPVGVVKSGGGGKKWLWMLVGAGAAGGAGAVLLKPKDEPEPPATGSIKYTIPVP